MGKRVARSTQQPDRVNTKTRRWLRAHARVCTLTFGSAWVGAMSEYRQRHACAACSTSALVLFFFFLHNGEFAELISANSAASPAVLGVGVHIHEAPVSPAGASCCSAPGPTQRRSRSAHATEVTQCYVAGSRRGVTSRGGWCQALGVWSPVHLLPD